MLKGLRILAGDAGFTLIEMLVTVTIIGILAAIVTVGVTSAGSNAQTQANKQLYASVQTGIDAYAASTPAAIGVPTSGSPAAAATGYYKSDGTAYTVAGTEFFVNLSSTTNSFNTFFRLPTPGWTIATSTTAGTGAQCLVTGTTASGVTQTFNLTACHN